VAGFAAVSSREKIRSCKVYSLKGALRQFTH
jgi:hypothetical protein